MSTSSSADAAGGWATQWFAGRRVLVTGGTSGIGAALAAGFAEAGAEVLATGLTEAEIAAAGQTAHGSVSYGQLDVRDGDAVRALIGGLDRLDVLVNCAGVIRRSEELEPEVFDMVVDVNLHGTMRTGAAARPLLAASGRGAILNLASMLSYFGGGLVPGYAASKGGIVQLTKSLAIAYAADGIRVNAVAPGWIETSLTQALRDDDARSGAILSRTPLARWGKPQDLVGGALYLCSPLAAFVTGTILNIDGGYAAA